MKKVLFAAVAVLALASCKKDYSCECKIDGESYKTTLKDVKKKDAKKACETWGTLYMAAGGSCDFN
ncbi:MAG TPA: lipoprotein [Taishania sp.]|nr:lipoprotein [Taishania sp.]